MKQQYMVFHRLMRDAQIYVGDSLSDGINLYGEKYEKNWIDFQCDPLLDIVVAEDEAEAVSIVGKDRDIHENNMYASPVRLNVSGAFLGSKEEYSFNFEATSFLGDTMAGIDIVLPDGRTARVALNRETCQMIFSVRNKDEEENSIEF